MNIKATDNYNTSVISEIMPLPVDEEKTVMPSQEKLKDNVVDFVEEATRRGRRPKTETEKLPGKEKDGKAMTQRERVLYDLFESEAAHEVNIILDNLYKLQDLSICLHTDLQANKMLYAIEDTLSETKKVYDRKSSHKTFTF